MGKDNLRRIIGPQGSVIRGLEADSASRLSIDDTGLVHIYSPGQDNYQTAVSLIEGITGAAIKVCCRHAPRKSCKSQNALLVNALCQHVLTWSMRSGGILEEQIAGL